METGPVAEEPAGQAADTDSVSAYASLPDRHRLFVDAYVQCGIGTKAILEIGFEGSRPDVAASKLMAHAEIQAAIEERTAEAIAAAGVTSANIMRELARIAFFDSRRICNDKGELLSIDKWPDDVAAVIAGVDIEVRRAGARVHKYRAAAKTEALKLLMQYKRLLVEKHEHTGKDGAPLPANNSTVYIVSHEEAKQIGQDLEQRI